MADHKASLGFRKDQPNLGLATTRHLLEELRVRGDVSMVAYPTTPAGADGAILSGLASAGLRSMTAETLAYRTVDGA